MLKNYLKIAWRNLTRNKTYAITNLAGLSIGLACVMLIILYVQDEWSFDRFHANGSRTYRIVRETMSPDGKEERGGNTGAPLAPAFVEGIPEIQTACRVRGGWSALVRKGSEVFTEHFMYVDSTFFSVFSFPLLIGNPATALNDPTHVVVSEDIARKYFNTTDAIGQPLVINEEGTFNTYIVSAVAKQTPLNSSIRFDILLPNEPRMQENFTKQWTNAFLNSFVVLKPDPGVNEKVRLARIEAKMNTMMAMHMGKFFEDAKKKHPGIYYRCKLQPFGDMHLDRTYNASNGINHWSDASYSYILGGIALFILVIACINFINLTLSNSLRRGKEIGIRKVSGGTRGELIRQFLSESLVLNLLAFLPALLLVQLSLPAFEKLANKNLSVSYLFHPAIMGLFALLILVNTLLSGFYPALVLSGFNPVQTLYGKFRLTGKNYLGKSLVVVQFAIATFLLVGTIVMQRQLSYMINKDEGFKTAGILDVSLPYPSDGKTAGVFRSLIMSHPAVRNAGVRNTSLTEFNSTFVVAGKKEMYNTPFFRMDENVLPMLDIPFVAGRNFEPGKADSLSCIVNQSMVQAAGWINPIGQQVRWDNHDYTVIGVVKDFHTGSMRDKIAPIFIAMSLDEYTGHMMVRVDPRQQTASIQAIQKAFRQVYPYNPCNVTPVDEQVVIQYAEEQRWKSIVSISAILAIFISCIGLLGLATLSIGQRIKEIGVRKVLGAGEMEIVRLLSQDFLKLVILAFIIATPLAWYFANHWLEDFAYHIPLSWALFAIVGLLITFVALATICLRALSAAKANPALSLRSE